MQTEEIRSDLIGALLIRQWLTQNLPHYVDGWSPRINGATVGAAERAKSIFPHFPLILAAQAPIARTAIERWGLTDVAYLAAGTPTPLSPTPDQLLYYTDANPGAVEEALQAGYNAQLVDVRNPEHFKKLDGVTTLIATGLMHFLPDQAARAMFANLAQMGFQTFVFNSANRDAAEALPGIGDVTELYAKFGIQLYFRLPADIAALLADHWRLEDVIPTPEFYQNHEFGPFLREHNFYTIYHAVAK